MKNKFKGRLTFSDCYNLHRWIFSKMITLGVLLTCCIMRVFALLHFVYHYAYIRSTVSVTIKSNFRRHKLMAIAVGSLLLLFCFLFLFAFVNSLYPSCISRWYLDVQNQLWNQNRKREWLKLSCSSPSLSASFWAVLSDRLTVRNWHYAPLLLSRHLSEKKRVVEELKQR